MSAFIKKTFIMFFMFCASSCSTSDALTLKRGVGEKIDPGAVASFTNDQTAVFAQLKLLAGLQEVADPLDPQQLQQVVTAGMYYTDSVCEQYLSSLWRADRVVGAATSEINLLGTATAGILGITSASAPAIAITAVAFGLTQDTVRNLGNTWLYSLEPSAVRTLVKNLQARYQQELSAQPAAYSDRAGAFRVLQGYLSLCLPAVIEAEVNNAASTATIEGSRGDMKNGIPPAVGIMVSSRFVDTSQDQVATALRTFLNADPGNLAIVREKTKETSAGDISPALLLNGDFAVQREQVARMLGLI